jgi:DHA2 family multidrug resistance protein
MSAPNSPPIVPLQGSQLWLAALLLAAANFVAVLDTTIANVALPNMQGSISASPEQLTWVLTLSDDYCYAWGDQPPERCRLDY